MAYSLNPFPTATAVDRNGGQLSTPWFKSFSALFNFLTANVLDFTQASVQVPLTGFSITVADKSQVLTLNPAGTLATGTVKMPVTAYDGQAVYVNSTQTVTSLTVSPSGTDTLKNAPTTIAAGTGFGYYYHAATTTWFRIF